MFALIAQGLVAKGCRVMLLDLWGRGYSDTPQDDCRHDWKLFVTQIIFALASSPVSWTDEGCSFSMVGFSLGGSITMSFAGLFPHLVESIVLLGPAGLLRRMPLDYNYFGFAIQRL